MVRTYFGLLIERERRVNPLKDVEGGESGSWWLWEDD
jgi:hypothetical protein